jgi:hypothetical protein
MSGVNAPARLDEVPAATQVDEVRGWSQLLGGVLLTMILVGQLVGLGYILFGPPPAAGKKVYNRETDRWEEPHKASPLFAVPGLLLGAPGPWLLRRVRRARGKRLVLSPAGSEVAVYREGRLLGTSDLKLLWVNQVPTILYGLIGIAAAMGEAYVAFQLDTTLALKLFMIASLWIPLSFLASPIYQRLVCTFYKLDVPGVTGNWIGFRRSQCRRAGLPT